MLVSISCHLRFHSKYFLFLSIAHSSAIFGVNGPHPLIKWWISKITSGLLALRGMNNIDLYVDQLPTHKAPNS